MKSNPIKTTFPLHIIYHWVESFSLTFELQDFCLFFLSRSANWPRIIPCISRMPTPFNHECVVLYKLIVKNACVFTPLIWIFCYWNHIFYIDDRNLSLIMLENRCTTNQLWISHVPLIIALVSRSKIHDTTKLTTPPLRGWSGKESEGRIPSTWSNGPSTCNGTNLPTLASIHPWNTH